VLICFFLLLFLCLVGGCVVVCVKCICAESGNAQRRRRQQRQAPPMPPTYPPGNLQFGYQQGAFNQVGFFYPTSTPSMSSGSTRSAVTDPNSATEITHLLPNANLVHPNNISSVSAITNDLQEKSASTSAETPNDDSDQQAKECVICFANPKNCCFNPCGHLCCCYDCGVKQALSKRSCPICRMTIQQVIKVYF